MTNERKSRLITITCLMSALLVAVAMIAAQYLAIRTPTPDLPVTGSSTEPVLGTVERWKLEKTTRERYNRLAELEWLSDSQYNRLVAIAEMLSE